MCFSAGASFTASAVLGTLGSFSLKRAEGKSQIMFASIPVLFAVQQFSEGLLWLSLSKDGYEEWQTAATYFFLFFAQFLWTTWIPVSMLLMETNKVRKKILYFISFAGIADSL